MESLFTYLLNLTNNLFKIYIYLHFVLRKGMSYSIKGPTVKTECDGSNLAY